MDKALAAHLCRCTGWRTIHEAGAAVGDRRRPTRDLAAAGAPGRRSRAAAPQRVGPDVALGAGGFADDHAPADALVAVPDGARGLRRRRDAGRGPPGRGQGAGPADDRRPDAAARPARRATGT